MKKSALVLVVLFSGFCSAFVRKPPHVRPEAECSPTDRILYFFDQQQGQYREKIWFHLDKPYYGVGDTIWYRAFLVNACTHISDTLSGFIYLDLFDRNNNLVSSKKIRRDSLGFSNNFVLPRTLAAGEYTLRAYTGWMLNFEKSSYFQKNITIGNSKVDPVHAEMSYTPTGAVIRFYDANDLPLTNTNVGFELYDRNHKRLSVGKQFTTSTGALIVEFPSDSVRNGGYVKTDIESVLVKYKRTFFLDPVNDTLDVRFFPEGGELVPGAPQRVAFKSVRSDGYPAEIRGLVFNQLGDTLSRLESEHDGMGSFLLIPRVGDSYHAVVEFKDTTITVALPTVKPEGCALSVIRSGQEVRYRVLGKIPAKSILVGHTRGSCRCMVPLSSSRSQGVIRTDSLPEGILHLLLVDSVGLPRTERLVYVSQRHARPDWNVRSDKPHYGKREKVRLELQLAPDRVSPHSSSSSFSHAQNYSVSITDKNKVRQDSLSENIRSYLLLTSDLKGYIHNAGYYFLDDSDYRMHYLDLVMLTHGWRRFNTPDLFTPELFTQKYYIEHGQFITGRVKSMFGAKAKQASVTALALQENAFTTSVTDSFGRFMIEGIDIQDTVVLLFSAQTKSKRPVQEIKLEPSYTRPEFQRMYPFLSVNKARNAEIDTADYLGTFYNGIDNEDTPATYDIEEITVVKDSPRRPRSSIFGAVYDTTDLANFKKMLLYNFILKIPGVSVDYRERPLRFTLKQTSGNDRFPAQIKVNDIIVNNVTFLTKYNVADVAYIGIIREWDNRNRESKWQEYMSGHNSFDGIAAELLRPDYPYRIEIVLKEGVSTNQSDFVTFKVTGYSPSVEFYHPVYDTPERFTSEKTDRRSTLYWNPYLSVSSDGKTFIEFYSDDSDDPRYEITIEGVTPEGIPVHYRSEVRTE